MVDMKLNERAFDAMLAGTKTIEIRAHSKKVSEVEVGDIIVFTSVEKKRTLEVTVVRVEHYTSVRELLETEGVKKTLSSTNDLEEGIIRIQSIPGYAKRITEGGVYAIEVNKC